MAEQSKGFFRVSLAEQLVRRKLAVGSCPLESHVVFLIFLIKDTVFLHRVFRAQEACRLGPLGSFRGVVGMAAFALRLSPGQMTNGWLTLLEEHF